MNFENWPEVPKELRPKSLFIKISIPEDEVQSLQEKGWRVQDVRLMATTTDGERSEAVKATLEGIRVGSIIEGAKDSIVRFLELEARVCGMTNNKDSPNSSIKAKRSEETVETLLDFAQLDSDTFIEVKRSRGRPKKVRTNG